ncbi:MAG TPA: thermonuclease family protein [Acidimicrobiales bacterium]|nr:thermonuclease family protein [Acidimicrobiales bacterium]
MTTPLAVVLAALTMVVVGVVIARGRLGGGPAPEEAGTARIVRVVDGDTVVADLGGREEQVRLLGIDTPESVDPQSPVECYGKEAVARTAEILPPGTAVRLVRDVEPRDRYSRLLAYVYRIDDGTFVNLALVSEGYAMTLTYPPNVAHADELNAAAARARNDRRGLWAAC